VGLDDILITIEAFVANAMVMLDDDQDTILLEVRKDDWQALEQIAGYDITGNGSQT